MHDPDPIEPKCTANRDRFWIGWSTRRRLTYAAYVIVGALLGFLVPPIFGGFLGSVIAVMSSAFVPNRFLTFSIGVISGVVIVLAALSEGSKGTCATSPVAPSAAAGGSVVGGLALAVVAACWPVSISQGVGLGLAGVLLTFAMHQAISRGGRAGLRKNLGMLRVGVGEVCATCGYDLRGLPDMTPCPECGGMNRYERFDRAHSSTPT